jgi:hypothetical protein
VLHLPDHALSHDYRGSVARPIKNYLEDNVQKFFEFARDRTEDFPDVKEIILVTGYTVVTSWAAAVFLDKKIDATLEFQSLPNDKMNLQWHVEDNIREHVPCHTSNPTQVCSLGLIHLTRTDSLLISIQRTICLPTNASTSVVFKQGTSTPRKPNSKLKRSERLRDDSDNLREDVYYVARGRVQADRKGKEGKRNTNENQRGNEAARCTLVVLFQHYFIAQFWCLLSLYAYIYVSCDGFLSLMPCRATVRN